jgi:hypothetical protein
MIHTHTSRRSRGTQGGATIATLYPITEISQILARGEVGLSEEA